MDEYAEEKRIEKNLIVRSGISETETTNNKRLRSTFCIEAIGLQTRGIATFLLREFVDVLAPYVVAVVNASLSQGRLSVNQKHAIVSPLLKKARS